MPDLPAAWYGDQLRDDPLNRALTRLTDRRFCLMGGCGQVGSHVATRLYEAGFAPDQIAINDNLSLGVTGNLPAPLRGNVDTRSHLDYASHPPRAEPDILIFTGGRSSGPHFSDQRDVIEELDAWRAILDWCVAGGTRLLFASTSSLCKTRPSTESERVWPGSLYELAKLGMEDMAIQRALTDGLDVTICRFFSVYGVTERHKGEFGNLYTQLLWCAREGQPFELWGRPGSFAPGTQTRDTIFAPEVARAVLHLATLPSPAPRLDDITSLVYNIGQGKPVSVQEMIEHVAACTGRRPPVETANVPDHLPNYVVHTWGDPARLHASGFSTLFTDHEANLRFINWALSDVQGYWDAVDAVRARTLAE